MNTSPPLRMIAIAAMAANRVIGREGKLPWHLPEDLKFFKQTTLGSAVLMGRKTYESILGYLGKPLPGRRNLVLSRELTSAAEGVTLIRSIDDLALVSGLSSPVYLIGGAALYESLLPQCDEVLLTYVYQDYAGDAFLPAFEHDFHLAEVLLRTADFEIRRYVRN